jgi:hypothetical protein
MVVPFLPVAESIIGTVGVNFCKSKHTVAPGEADQQRNWADDRWNENQYCEPVTHGTSPKPRRSFASLETDMVGFDGE